MEEGGSFILCESDCLKSSFSVFQEMKEKREYTDVTVVCKSRLFSVHRVVLAARIPYFRKILASQDREISLNEVDPDVLESIINFAYEGKLKVTTENVRQMLLALGYFQLDQVQKACQEFLAKTLHHNRSLITLPSDLAIRKNFDAFSDTQEFLSLPYSFLKELVGRDDLRVRNEAKVFEGVVKWVKACLEERRHFLPYLLTEIRMASLTPDYLVEHVATESLIQTSDPCKHILEEAKNYHLLPKKRSRYFSFCMCPRLPVETQNALNDTFLTTDNENVAPDANVNVESANIVGTAARDKVACENTTIIPTSQNVSSNNAVSTTMCQNPGTATGPNASCNSSTSTVTSQNITHNFITSTAASQNSSHNCTVSATTDQNACTVVKPNASCNSIMTTASSQNAPQDSTMSTATNQTTLHNSTMGAATSQTTSHNYTGSTATSQNAFMAAWPCASFNYVMSTAAGSNPSRNIITRTPSQIAASNYAMNAAALQNSLRRSAISELASRSRRFNVIQNNLRRRTLSQLASRSVNQNASRNFDMGRATSQSASRMNASASQNPLELGLAEIIRQGFERSSQTTNPVVVLRGNVAKQGLPKV